MQAEVKHNESADDTSNERKKIKIFAATKNISTEFEPPLCLKFYTKYEIENFGNFCSIFADFTWKSEFDFSCEDKALFDEVFS